MPYMRAEIERGIGMTERELRLKLEDKLSEICKILAKDKHIELHNSPKGIKIYEVEKKIVK